MIMKSKITIFTAFLVFFILPYGSPVRGQEVSTQEGICDPDESGRVDGFDLGLIGRSLDSKPGDPRWDQQADCNQDGIINEKDLELLKKHFGKTIPKTQANAHNANEEREEK